MKVLRLMLVLALAVCAFAIPATPVSADCPYDCYSHGDCYEICGCLGFTTWAYCARTLNGYPGSCLCQ